MALTGSSPDDRMAQVMSALDDGLQGLELDDDAAEYLRSGCLPEFASLSEEEWQQSYSDIIEVAEDVGEAAAEDANERSRSTVDATGLRESAISILAQRPTPVCRKILRWLQSNPAS